jgi:hypothetical protein
MAGSANSASLPTVHQVANAESAGPKQPHDVWMPRATTDASATMKAIKSTLAAAEVAGKNQPPAK